MIGIGSIVMTVLIFLSPNLYVVNSRNVLDPVFRTIRLMKQLFAVLIAQ